MAILGNGSFSITTKVLAKSSGRTKVIKIHRIIITTRQYLVHIESMKIAAGIKIWIGKSITEALIGPRRLSIKRAKLKPKE
jgi:hypothetical protein